MKYLLVALLIAFLVPMASAQETEFLDFGTDPAGDDGDTIPETGVGAPAGGSSIDDIIGGAVRTAGDNLEFRIATTTSPDDEDLLWNTYCWAANFEVEGQSTEYIGMVCYDYNPAVNDWVAMDTNRGEEVASGATWDEANNYLIITVPLSNINAQPGDVLKDIYMMTYSGGLYVDDVFPDAKSDRNAAANLGKYVIGANELGGPVVIRGEQLADQFADTDATNIALTYSYDELSTQTWHYNWTNQFSTGNISMAADPVAGSVHFQITDAENQTITDAQLEAYFTENQTFDGFAGVWQITVTFTDFQGNATLSILPDAPPTPVPGLPTGGNPNTPGKGTPTGGTFNDGNSQDESNDTPPGAFLLGLIGLALLAKRKSRSE